MWTLRDLFMMLSPQYAQQWREQQASRMGTGRMDNDATLQNLLYDKQQTINKSPDLNESAFRPMSVEEYYREMMNAVPRYKYPKEWDQGMI